MIQPRNYNRGRQAAANSMHSSRSPNSQQSDALDRAGARSNRSHAPSMDLDALETLSVASSGSRLNRNTSFEKFSDTERRIEARALRQVSAMLQSSENMEKLDQIKDNVERKKANIEARLKTAVQSQLEGVRSGLEQLKQGRDECVEMQKSMQVVDSLFSSCMELGDWVQDMKDSSQEHSQLSAAMDNLRQLFKTPELLQEAQRHIDNKNYLEAHSVLTDLEMSRDDLIFELHKNPHRSTTDEQMIMKYFGTVEKMKQDRLHTAIQSELADMFSKVKTDPSKFVAALKVIEREEYLDKQYAKRQTQAPSGQFVSCARPYGWRTKALNYFHEMVDRRLGPVPEEPQRNPSNESNQGEGFEGGRRPVGRDSGWIIANLEQVRVRVLDDLLVVKQLCVSLFPPIYNIFEKFLHWYHMAVSAYVRTLLSLSLEGNEIVALLTFDKEYVSDKLMADPRLKVNTKKLPDLIDEGLKKETVDTYIDNTRDKIRGYLGRLLDQENSEWYSEYDPELDGESYYCTTFPNSLKKLIQDTMKVADQVSSDVSKRIFKEILYEVETFIEDLKQAVDILVQEHNASRDTPPHYLNFMISIANNCYVMAKHIDSLCDKIGIDPSELGDGDTFTNPMGPDAPDDLFPFGKESRIHISLSLLAKDAVDHLLHEVFLDLQGFFDKLMTKDEWLDTEINYGPVDTINATIEDYATDFVNIRPLLFNILVKECEARIAVEYIKALFDRTRMKITNAHTLEQVADRMIREGDQLERFISLLLSNHPDVNETMWEVKPMDAVKRCADVLKCSKEMLYVDIRALTDSFKGVKPEHVKQLLTIRNDMSSAEIQEQLSGVVDEGLEPNARRAGVPVIFQSISVQTGFWG